jgi:hypothetical protein
MPTRREVMLNSILVRIDSLDASHECVDEFHPASNYLHAVELVKNNGLWPVDLVVQSSLQSQQQLAYLRTGGPQKWEFSATVLPDGGFPEQTALVDCVAKVSGREEITTIFTTDTGFRDRMAIEVRIRDASGGKEEARVPEEVPIKK